MMNLKVSVTTRQNGYSLAIDKEEFMYRVLFRIVWYLRWKWWF